MLRFHIHKFRDLKLQRPPLVPQPPNLLQQDSDFPRQRLCEIIQMLGELERGAFGTHGVLERMASIETL